ncbi:bifunctional adenosylcobinamide kinase/adenosylcobinamide-phosphate guanylyltransferase [Blautia sp. HCP3S3_H10_1]|uniref:bifunctional adenosylcobinamide kinase/adenosylcobinamide-phosphate guanylyltransferase n=1 Tax=unclassified Blautia TaxID=2648079 RepID=UPI003F8FA60E
MEMIIGGAFQGKSAYVKEQYSEIVWKNGADIEKEELMTAEGVLDFQEFIRKELKAGNDLSNFAEELAVNNPDIILVSLEVGYGVVPMDAFDRKYREAVGRICTSLAAKSQKVIRVVCGIGMVIKNA